MFHSIPSSKSARVTRLVSAGVLLAILAGLTPRASANSFTIANGQTNTSGQTLAAGQTGAIDNGGTLKVGGSTVAVTVTGNATVTNSGTLQQTGTGRGIDLNTANVSLGITNNAGAVIQTADNDTIRANKGSNAVTLDNYGTITSLNASAGGAQAIDWNAITSASNVLHNYSTGIITASEADAVRPGVNGKIYNDGTIKSTTATGSSSDGVDLQANTGVTIVNASNGSDVVTGSGLIEGARHGITGGNTDPSVANGAFTVSLTNNLGGTVQGDNGSGVNIDGLNANEVVTIVNHGTITGNGQTGDGDGVDVDGVVSLTNTGTIKSLNSFASSGTETSEGVTVGGGTITNSGLIEGDVAAGNSSAVGRGITLAGVDKDANGNAIPPQGIYADTTVTNSGTIRGQSDSAIAVTSQIATGFKVTIDNRAGGLIEGAGATAATIQAGVDNDTITNAGSIINDGGDAKVAIALGAGNDSLTVTGGSAVITGGIDGGTGTDALTFDLGAGHSFAHGGTISNFEQVTALSGHTTLNGHNTYAGATTVGDGTAAATLSVNGRHDGGGAYDVKAGSTLGGTGTLALATPSTTVTVETGGTFDVGAGLFTIESGSVTDSGVFRFELDGSSAGGANGYGQLVFSGGNTGSIALNAGATLHLDLGFTPTWGTQFVLFNLVNDSAFISGAFDGLADGAIFTQDGQRFQISYHGGTGNDLVLRAIPDAAPTLALIGGAFAGLAALRQRKRN